MRKLKRSILLGITYTEMLVAVLAMAAMDSPDPTIPIIVLLQAIAWIGLFIKANPAWAAQERRWKCKKS